MDKSYSQFVIAVKEERKDSPFCPYATEYKGLWGEHKGYDCRLCEELIAYSGKFGVDPCLLEDFNNCPLFPHGEKK